jgi:hypothetical protein
MRAAALRANVLERARRVLALHSVVPGVARGGPLALARGLASLGALAAFAAVADTAVEERERLSAGGRPGALGLGRL